jgi:hypothetical protein
MSDPRAILSTLPASLDWAVAFDAAVLRRVLDAADLDAMLRPQPGIAINETALVALTSAGSHFESSNPRPVPGSILNRFAAELDLVPSGSSICVGVGGEGDDKVLVQVAGEEAVAVWRHPPEPRGWGLLPAVGVQPSSVATVGEHTVVRFSFDLGMHLRAAKAAAFARTDGCIRYFLGGGRVEGTLALNLLGDADTRLGNVRRRTIARLAEQVVRFCDEGLAMQCRPGGGKAPHPLGNTVPLGLALYALRAFPTSDDALRAATRAADCLAARRQDRLWAFQAGDLVTALDSALVLLGVEDLIGVRELETFRSPHGGYRAQRCGRGPGAMPVSDRNRHWCEPDVPTTALVQALRVRHGLPATVDPTWLLSRSARRDGLFFANPYLADWAYALGLPIGASRARRRLQDEVLASASADRSFGAFDRVLSTASAVLCVSATGCDRRTLRPFQLRLLELLDEDGETSPSTPFYSALAIDGRLPPRALLEEMRRQPDWQVVTARGRWFRVTLYEDATGMVTTALAGLALCADGERRPPEHGATRCASRYRATDLLDYIEHFALPPYLEAHASTASAGTSDGRARRSKA